MLMSNVFYRTVQRHRSNSMRPCSMDNFSEALPEDLERQYNEQCQLGGAYVGALYNSKVQIPGQAEL